MRIRPHIAPLGCVEELLDGVDMAPVAITPDFDRAVLLSPDEGVAKVAVDDFNFVGGLHSYSISPTSPLGKSGRKQ